MIQVAITSITFDFAVYVIRTWQTILIESLSVLDFNPDNSPPNEFYITSRAIFAAYHLTDRDDGKL